MLEASVGNRLAIAPHPENMMVRPWERRAQRRFRRHDAARKFNMDSIDVRVTTTERRFGATLVDLSAGGAGVLLSVPLPVDSPVGIELQIGQYTVAAFGQVRNVMSQGGRHKLGVQFIHIDAAEAELLRLLEMPGRPM